MFFFFKQKTAYEMRISDWSSDVCSSDLLECALRGLPGRRLAARDAGFHRRTWHRAEPGDHADRAARLHRRIFSCVVALQHDPHRLLPRYLELYLGRLLQAAHRRSEEHTSELQSLMRISYAVFCLKKKKKQTINNTYFTILHKEKI